MTTITINERVEAALVAWVASDKAFYAALQSAARAVTPKKRRGRAATGRDPHVTSRMPAALIAEVEAWASANDTSRSEAFRRLVELGLKVKR
jgi:hypothetical protein